MTKQEEKTLDVSKQEVVETEEMERTRDRRCYIPRTDIYETKDEIMLIADVPGADDKSLDISLEKNILTINAYIDEMIPEGFKRIYSEYESGDYKRSFKLSDEIDQSKIKAVVKNGELRLQLPKSEPAKAKKISVKSA
jgi:HSP20 family molecular chaperone IbpA